MQCRAKTRKQAPLMTSSPWYRQLNRVFLFRRIDFALCRAFRCLVREVGRISPVRELAILELEGMWELSWKRSMADQNTYTELNWVPDPRTAAERVFFKRTLALTGLQCECLVYDVYLVSAFSGNCTLLTCTTRCRRQTRSLFNSERCTGPCCEPGSAADYTASLLALCCDDQVPSFRVRCTGTCWLRGSSCFGWFIFSRCLWLIPDTLGRAVGCLTI